MYPRYIFYILRVDTNHKITDENITRVNLLRISLQKNSLMSSTLLWILIHVPRHKIIIHYYQRAKAPAFLDETQIKVAAPRAHLPPTGVESGQPPCWKGNRWQQTGAHLVWLAHECTPLQRSRDPLNVVGKKRPESADTTTTTYTSKDSQFVLFQGNRKLARQHQVTTLNRTTSPP